MTVQVDAVGVGFASSMAAFFPDHVTVRPGETVRFASVFTGEPHTVAMGRLVDAALTAVAAAGPGVDPNWIPQLRLLPRFFQGGTVIGQSAAQPCFLDAGVPSSSAACPPRSQPPFNGRQAFYGSGWLPDKAVFAVKIAPDTKPGAYGFVCLTHRRVMAGTITVVADGTPVPSAAEVSDQGGRQRARLERQLQAAVHAATATSPAPLAGVIPDLPNAIADDFFPGRIDVVRGGSVTWTVQGPHTITFNPRRDAKPALVRAPDGTVSFNPTAIAAARSPTPTAARRTIRATFDGRGFLSSGVLESFPPYDTYTVRFTRRGRYRYFCLLHADMDGVVTVR